MGDFFNKPQSLYDLAVTIAERLESPDSKSVLTPSSDPAGDSTAAAGSDGECPNGSDTVSMEVTAYTSGPESTGKKPGDPDYGRTAKRTIAGAGTIAAPPEYDFYTRMYVPGYGWGTVLDRGAAIQGNHLDVWFATVEEARQWGRRTVNVIVCRK